VLFIVIRFLMLVEKRFVWNETSLIAICIRSKRRKI